MSNRSVVSATPAANAMTRQAGLKTLSRRSRIGASQTFDSKNFQTYITYLSKPSRQAQPAFQR